MFRLESFLEVKAADTLEGLDYSETVYATAKMRLQRKFGGPRRQVQNQIERASKHETVACRQCEGLREIFGCFGEHCGFAANTSKTK